ncbi:glycosyltransferase [Ferruginibacter sp.]|uniref:glycosyltransferase n=1 Tax=Ferruginibacter sp. TaxID=1940288 RepID=UPI00265A1D58|nr:glycosyltransferase [Ferruginibacter sp.]
MKVIQINSIVNSGSTGRIAEDIGKVLLDNGHQSFIAFGRGNRPSKSQLIKIGNKWDTYWHGLQTMVFDRHAFASTTATQKLIKEIEILKPDVIGLHNLHGYYIDIKILFTYLRTTQIPVVWTLFDCWSFTGHCTYFDDIDCTKWIQGCFECPKKKKYPSSFLIDNSKENYLDKKHLYADFKNLQIVVHSKWLQNIVGQSFLNEIPIHHIFSGINLEIFKPLSNKKEIVTKYQLANKKIVLGVASTWDKRKGLNDFIQLSNYLSSDEIIVLIGVNKQQLKLLQLNIVGIERTEDINELAALYSAADVFVNPTWQDNFPTTNIEALACGTPVITYNTGGSPEAIDKETGFVIEKGNLQGLAEAIGEVFEKGKDHYRNICRQRAEQLFNKNDRYSDYLKLYESLLIVNGQ